MAYYPQGNVPLSVMYSDPSGMYVDIMLEAMPDVMMRLFIDGSYFYLKNDPSLWNWSDGYFRVGPNAPLRMKHKPSYRQAVEEKFMKLEPPPKPPAPWFTIPLEWFDPPKPPAPWFTIPLEWFDPPKPPAPLFSIPEEWWSW